MNCIGPLLQTRVTSEVLAETPAGATLHPPSQSTGRPGVPSWVPACLPTVPSPQATHPPPRPQRPAILPGPRPPPITQVQSRRVLAHPLSHDTCLSTSPAPPLWSSPVGGASVQLPPPPPGSLAPTLARSPLLAIALGKLGFPCTCRCWDHRPAPPSMPPLPCTPSYTLWKPLRWPSSTLPAPRHCLLTPHLVQKAKPRTHHLQHRPLCQGRSPAGQQHPVHDTALKTSTAGPVMDLGKPSVGGGLFWGLALAITGIKLDAGILPQATRHN